MADLRLTAAKLEIMTSEEEVSDVRVTAVKLEVMAPVEQSIPATQAFVTCFEIFPAPVDGG